VGAPQEFIDISLCNGPVNIGEILTQSRLDTTDNPRIQAQDIEVSICFSKLKENIQLIATAAGEFTATIDKGVAAGIVNPTGRYPRAMIISWKNGAQQKTATVNFTTPPQRKVTR
jgi:hypothetical protein